MPESISSNDTNEPTYTVTIADASGDTVVQMTKPEIEATATANNAWVFVNDRLVNTSAIAETNLDASSAIRLMPGLVGGAERTYRVTIADATGDTVVEMSEDDILEASASGASWVFIDNQLVNTSAITTSQLDAAEAIRVMPGLVGGDEPTYTVTIADASGDTVVQMTKPEIEATATANNAWVFVNDRLVNSSDLAETNLDASSAIRLMPGLVGGF
jgi:hypothetical protein